MKKFLLHILGMAVAFCVVLFLFSRVDWMSVFHLDDNRLEKKLGKLYWDAYSQDAELIANPSITEPVDSLFTHICRANGIDRSSISLHVVNSEEVNAFAMPGRHIVVHTSLIGQCRHEAELAGVMAHELGHTEYGHVMKTLAQNIGTSVLVSMASGNGGAEAMKKAVRMLTSTAYSRKMESEADAAAVDYLLRAEMNPEHLADFFQRLDEEREMPALVEWISTHPDSGKRADAVREAVEKSGFCNERLVLSEETWGKLQKAVTTH